jgi:hypothetical protein
MRLNDKLDNPVQLRVNVFVLKIITKKFNKDFWGFNPLFSFNTMTSKSKSIRYINWETEAVQPGNEHWILPQLMAHIGSNWPIVREGELFSPTQTIKRWAELSSAGELELDGALLNLGSVKALVKWLCTSPRGDILTGMTQTKDQGVRWSAPVPLILSAFKEFRGVGYNSWNWSDPSMTHLVDRDLQSWSQHFGVEQPWGPDELISFREGSLEVKSGARQGTARKPESTSQVYGVTDPTFKALPRLMKLALTQLWCFHPRVRTNLMITNHMDLDSHPEPLVAAEVLEVKPTTKPDQSSPWDL